MDHPIPPGNIGMSSEVTSLVIFLLTGLAAGWIASLTSGEGFVCRFRGPGVVYIQSRNPRGFGSWVRQFLPTAE